MTDLLKTPTTPLGAFIRRKRTERGLSLGGLARASNVTKAQIHVMEKGDQENPTLNTMIALSSALGVSVVTFVRAAISEEPHE